MGLRQSGRRWRLTRMHGHTWPSFVTMGSTRFTQMELPAEPAPLIHPPRMSLPAPDSKQVYGSEHQAATKWPIEDSLMRLACSPSVQAPSQLQICFIPRLQQ